MSIEDIFLRNTANSSSYRTLLRDLLPKKDFESIFHFEICFMLRNTDNTPVDFRYLVITPTILYVLPLQPTALPPEGIGHVIELQDVGVVEDCKDERTLSFLMPGLKKRAMHFQLRQSEAARRREEGDRKTRRTIHESGVLKGNTLTTAPILLNVVTLEEKSPVFALLRLCVERVHLRSHLKLPPTTTGSRKLKTAFDEVMRDILETSSVAKRIEYLKELSAALRTKVVVKGCAYESPALFRFLINEVTLCSFRFFSNRVFLDNFLTSRLWKTIAGDEGLLILSEKENAEKFTEERAKELLENPLGYLKIFFNETLTNERSTERTTQDLAQTMGGGATAAEKKKRQLTEREQRIEELKTRILKRQEEKKAMTAPVNRGGTQRGKGLAATIAGLVGSEDDGHALAATLGNLAVSQHRVLGEMHRIAELQYMKALVEVLSSSLFAGETFHALRRAWLLGAEDDGRGGRAGVSRGLAPWSRLPFVRAVHALLLDVRDIGEEKPLPGSIEGIKMERAARQFRKEDRERLRASREKEAVDGDESSDDIRKLEKELLGAVDKPADPNQIEEYFDLVIASLYEIMISLQKIAVGTTSSWLGGERDRAAVIEHTADAPLEAFTAALVTAPSFFFRFPPGMGEDFRRWEEVRKIKEEELHLRSRSRSVYSAFAETRATNADAFSDEENDLPQDFATLEDGQERIKADLAYLEPNLWGLFPTVPGTRMIPKEAIVRAFRSAPKLDSVDGYFGKARTYDGFLALLFRRITSILSLSLHEDRMTDAESVTLYECLSLISEVMNAHVVARNFIVENFREEIRFVFRNPDYLETLQHSKSLFARRAEELIVKIVTSVASKK